MNVDCSAIWQPEPKADGYRLYKDDVFLAEVGGVDEYRFQIDAEVGDSFRFSIEAFARVGNNILTGPRTHAVATVEQETTP